MATDANEVEIETTKLYGTGMNPEVEKFPVVIDAIDGSSSRTFHLTVSAAEELRNAIDDALHQVEYRTFDEPDPDVAHDRAREDACW